MLAKLIKISALAAYTAFISLLVFLYVRGGDMLLDHLAESMRLKISYKSWCTSLDAFLFRMTILESVEITASDSPASIICEKAYVEFDYGELVSRGAVELITTLNNPKIKINGSSGAIDQTELLRSIPGDLATIADGLIKEGLSKIYCDILLHDDTVDIKRLEIFSADIIVYIDGFVNDRGDFNLNIKAHFSPNFMHGLPENSDLLLNCQNGGWGNLSVKLANSADPPSFRMESDNFRLVIGGRPE